MTKGHWKLSAGWTSHRRDSWIRRLWAINRIRALCSFVRTQWAAAWRNCVQIYQSLCKVLGSWSSRDPNFHFSSAVAPGTWYMLTSRLCRIRGQMPWPSTCKFLPTYATEIHKWNILRWKHVHFVRIQWVVSWRNWVQRCTTVYQVYIFDFVIKSRSQARLLEFYVAWNNRWSLRIQGIVIHTQDSCDMHHGPS